MLEEEEEHEDGEEEDHEEEEEGEEGGEEEDGEEDLCRKFIEDEFSDDSVERAVFISWICQKYVVNSSDFLYYHYLHYLHVGISV